jgi:hypothetical protein
MDKSANELFAMLKTAEAGMQKNTKQVLMVNKKASLEKKLKSKKKSNGAGKTVSQKTNKGGATSKTASFYCRVKGHWKRNCKKYLAGRRTVLSVKVSKLYN